MPPNLFGHTTSGYKWGPHEVAYFVGKGETNGVVELSRLHGSERYAVCFDARQAAAAGVESVETPSTSCESCHATDHAVPHRWGASCKYGGKENPSDYTSDYKRQKSEFQIFIATNVATTESKVQKT